MRYALFILLAGIPLAEIAVLIQVGRWVGVWWTIAFILASAATGSVVLHQQGFKLMNRVVETMAAGKPPVGPVIEGGFLMLAGLLLIVPGLITDAVGLLLLIPKLRRTIATWSVRRFFRSMSVRTATFGQRPADTPWPGQDPAKEQHPGRNEQDQAYAPGDGPIIEGEFERLGERNLDPRRHANGDARRTKPNDGPSDRSR